MKPLFRLLTIAVFLVLLAGSYVYFEFVPDNRLPTLAKTASDEELLSQLEAEYEAYWQEKELEGVVESRLTYDTKIAVVHVGEMNTDVLFGSSIQSLVPYRVTYNEDTKSMYYYSESDIPRRDDKLVAIHDVYSLDVLLEEQVHRGAEKVQLPFRPLEASASLEEDGYVIVPEARLFTGTGMTIETNEDTGEIQVSFDGEAHTIGAGQSTMFERIVAKGEHEAFSKVVVTYLGLWDSIDMKYVVGQ